MAKAKKPTLSASSSYKEKPKNQEKVL